MLSHTQIVYVYILIVRRVAVSAQYTSRFVSCIREISEA